MMTMTYRLGPIEISRGINTRTTGDIWDHCRRLRTNGALLIAYRGLLDLAKTLN